MGATQRFMDTMRQFMDSLQCFMDSLQCFMAQHSIHEWHMRLNHGQIYGMYIIWYTFFFKYENCCLALGTITDPFLTQEKELFFS